MAVMVGIARDALAFACGCLFALALLQSPHIAKYSTGSAYFALPTGGPTGGGADGTAVASPGQRVSVPDPPSPAGASDHIKQVLTGCGDICRSDMPGTPSLFFDFIAKQVDCDALLQNAAIDAPMVESEPPRTIPTELQDAFTYGGRVIVRPWGTAGPLNQRYLGGQAMVPTWEAAHIDEQAALCASGTLGGSYGPEMTTKLRDVMRNATAIVNGSVLVIGSERPWLEACLVHLGARQVTTLEYGGIVSKHPRVTTMTPAVARANARSLRDHFDAVVSFSSVEHSGLGRYGDALNPWGDRQAIARAWCMTRSGGQMVLGVPSGGDSIEYNAHRVYGNVQLPHLTANWKQVAQEIYGGSVMLVCEK